jgi:subtilisin family serine protease
VHALGHSGAGVKVGVADTAIDCAQPDISANLIDSEDFVGAGTHGGCWLPGELSELHATHVAGTVVGVFNSLGVFGVAHGSSLYHARVLGPSGGTTAEVMAGVEWLAEEAGVRVINLSLGGGVPSIAELRFYQQVRQSGVLVVAAAGNNGSTRISYPARYAPNIAVGAVDNVNAHASFSQTGLGLDVSAPGVNILSSVPNGTGSEASVTTNAAFFASGLEFAGKTSAAGVSGTLVNCGQAIAVLDCPPSVSGNIALIQRGTNTFAEKVANAMTAGAAAAIIYNNVPGHFVATLGTPTNNGTPWIPAVSVSDTAGATLAGQAGSSTNVVNMASSWDLNSGTSMATPHVTGVVALMWGAAPSRTPTFIESVLYSTSVDLGVPGYDTTFGYGLVNALAAVQKAIQTPDVAP